MENWSGGVVEQNQFRISDFGILELGELKNWNDGVLESWSDGISDSLGSQLLYKWIEFFNYSIFIIQ